MSQNPEGPTWEALEVVANVIGVVFMVAGAVWTLQGLGLTRSGVGIGRTDRLVGGVVVAIFGAAILAGYALFDR